MRAFAITMMLAHAASAASTETQLSASASEPTPLRASANAHTLFSSAGNGNRALLNESNVRAEYDRLNLGVFFTNRFASKGTSGQAIADRPFLLEKASLAFEGERLRIKLGDSSQELGRGLALSLYRDSVFGLDTTLQGAAVQFAPRSLTVNVMGGRVNTLKVPIAISPQPNPLPTSNVYLVAGEAKIGVLPDTKVGGHYLLAKSRPLSGTRFDQQWTIAGAAVQADGVADAIDIYAEGNVLNSVVYGATEMPGPTGYGNYASAAYSTLDWKTRLEVKDYRQFSAGLNRPPNVEDDIVPSINTDNVTATRVYTERRLGDSPKNLVSASFLYGWDYTYRTQVNHGIIGGKFEGPLRAAYEWKAGYRWLPNDLWLGHAAAKAKFKTFKGQAFELGWRKWYQRYGLDMSPIDEDHNALDLSYVFSDRYSVNVGYEWVPTVYEDENPHYLNAGGTVKYGALATRVFVGRTSGGSLCSGGVCRRVAPYTGAYIDTTVSF